MHLFTAEMLLSGSAHSMTGSRKLVLEQWA